MTSSGGATTVLRVGVFCWMWVAALGLQATACLDVVGAVGGCTVGAVGAEVDEVVTGCPATSTLVCLSGLTASG